MPVERVKDTETLRRAVNSGHADSPIRSRTTQLRH
jgi:hypothetical protein